jgi:YfiH family protein
MPLPAVESSIEVTSIGRIVVPPNVPRGFRVFYTTIDFDGQISEELLSVAGAPLATCKQVHGPTVVRVDAAVLGRTAAGETPAATPQCDALWTSEKNIALGIKGADCLPVSLIEPRHAIIANIHSGWRGAVRGITAAALDAVVNLDPRSSFAYLGPSIRVCCFEVGEEVAAQFDPNFVDRSRGAKPHVDIPALTVATLRRRGFPQERIVDTQLCTRCDGSIFHSYRRDRGSGRNLAIVAQ